ncbi:MAG: transposase [Acidimicrobiales bacterium]
MSVVANGKNLIFHAGTSLFAELADRSGLTKGMSEAMSQCGISWHTHDPGVALAHLAVAIADGADCLSDLSILQEQGEMFGPVASVSTAWRALEATSSVELTEISKACSAARARVWEVHSLGNSLTLDFDATLVTSYSEKQDGAHV